MQMFRECGSMSFLISGLGLLTTLAAFIALALAILKPRWGLILAVVALAMSCSPPAAGVVGSMMGKNKTREALDSVGLDPAQKERIRQAGEAEAAQCTSLGLLTAPLPLLLGVVALGVAAVRRRGEPGR